MHDLTFDDVKALILALFKNKLLIFLFALTGLCAGLLYSARQPVVHIYGATATVSIVGQSNISGGTILTNYVDMITSYRVIEHVVELLEAEELTANQIRRMTSTASRGNSHILEISVRNQSPQLAILVANAMAESFVRQVSIVTGNNSLQVLDFSRSANIVSSNRNERIKLFAPFAAFVVGCAFIMAVELSSKKLRLVKQCVTDPRELLAVIPKSKRKK